MRTSLLGVAAVLVVVGGATMLTPYSTKLNTPNGRAFEHQVRCKSPLSDALTRQPMGWYNYDSAHPDDYPRAWGDMCAPESRWRLSGGLVASVSGIGLCLFLVLRGRREVGN